MHERCSLPRTVIATNVRHKRTPLPLTALFLGSPVRIISVACWMRVWILLYPDKYFNCLFHRKELHHSTPTQKNPKNTFFLFLLYQLVLQKPEIYVPILCPQKGKLFSTSLSNTCFSLLYALCQSIMDHVSEFICYWQSHVRASSAIMFSYCTSFKSPNRGKLLH